MDTLNILFPLKFSLSFLSLTSWWACIPNVSTYCYFSCCFCVARYEFSMLLPHSVWALRWCNCSIDEGSGKPGAACIFGASVYGNVLQGKTLVSKQVISCTSVGLGSVQFFFALAIYVAFLNRFWSGWFPFSFLMKTMRYSNERMCQQFLFFFGTVPSRVAFYEVRYVRRIAVWDSVAVGASCSVLVVPIRK